MLQTPHLIALDLDGTVLTRNHTITPRTTRAVRALVAKGVKVLVCTGRPLRSSRAYAEELGLTASAILYNGAVWYDFDNERFRHAVELPSALATEVATLMHQTYPDILSSVERQDGWFWSEARYRAMPPVNTPTGVGDLWDFTDKPVLKMLFRHPTKPAGELAETLRHLPLYVTWSAPDLLEVMQLNVSKQAMLAHVAKHLDIAQQDIAAFGDEQNDIEMLAWVGYGVAMGNATEAVARVANKITDSNDAEGVAKQLEAWV